VTDQLIDVSLKSGLIALAGLGLAATMTGFRAAVRHSVVLVSLILCLAVPFAARFGPRHDVEIPALAVPIHDIAETAPKTREIKPRQAKNDSANPASIPTEWLLAAAYVAGAGLVAARYVVGLARLRQIDRRSQSAPEDVESLAQDLAPGLKFRVKVASSDQIPCAMTAGTFRPTIFLPEESVAWSQSRLVMVLRHELAHVRRRDAASQLLAEAVVALYWFNPAVWFGARAMRGYAELAADEAVINAGIRPTDYAQDLLHLARQMGMRPRWVLGPELLLMKNQRIENRLKAILSPAARPRGFTTSQSLALLAAAGIVTFGISTLRANAGGPGPDQRKPSEVKLSMARLKQLGLATMLYASEHDVLPPATTTEEARRLVEPFVDSKDTFQSGLAGATFEFNTKLAGVPLVNLKSPAETVSWYEKVPNAGTSFHFVFVDGHVVRYSGSPQPNLAQRLSVTQKDADASGPAIGGMSRGQ
jgi:beta-lactamase regulating signal transducer with metallopeptidase domain